MLTSQRIDAAREAASVLRFHTARTIHDETVGHHTFNMVNLLLIMTNGEVSRNLLIAAVCHDLGEPAVGDIPSPVKRAMPKELQNVVKRMEDEAVLAIHPYAPIISNEEAATLKLADNIDGLLKCRDELRLGNRAIRAIGDRYIEYIHAITDKWDTYRVFAEQCIYLYRQEL